MFVRHNLAECPNRLRLVFPQNPHSPQLNKWFFLYFFYKEGLPDTLYAVN